MKSQLAESDNSAVETSSQAAPLNATAEAAVAPTRSEVKTQQNIGASTAGTNGRPTTRRKGPPKRRAAGRPHPARQAHPPHVAHHYESLVDEGEKDSFFGRHRTKIVIAVLVLLVGGVASFVKPGSGPAPKAPERIVSFQPLPPLPPPPPKLPPTPPPKEEKMETAPQPAEAKPKEADKPKVEQAKETLGTNLKGNGPGLSGLGTSGDGGGFGGPGSGGGGNKLAIFTGQVKSKVTEALRNNPRTRKATLDIRVRIWLDPTTGHVARVMLDSSTSDTTLDDAIRQALSGILLPEPPTGTKLPIIMHLKATRP